MYNRKNNGNKYSCLTIKNDSVIALFLGSLCMILNLSNASHIASLGSNDLHTSDRKFIRDESML